MILRVRAAWARLPRWSRWVLAGYLIGFADGTGAHIRDLARGGIHVYAAWGPVPVQVFLVGLVVLDPLVFVLVALAQPAGVLQSHGEGGRFGAGDDRGRREAGH